MTVQEYAYAKLNLTLDVTAKRDDGYHDMLMVMQTVSLTDQIVITQTEGKEIRAIVSSETRPDEDAGEVRFSLKKAKVHLFSRETEARIYGTE